MNLENKMISPRQGFRIGILENITLGMVVIPYITVNISGRWHFLAFLIGLLLGGIYMVIMYLLSGRLAEALPANSGAPSKEAMSILGVGGFSRAAGLLYMVRFVLRAGLIMLFFGKTVQEFLLQSFNLWVIIIAFALVCGYGAARDIEKRGRMLELLFPWMVVPVILVAVFSISSINLGELYRGLMGVDYDMLGQGTGGLNVFRAGYVAFLVTTSSELMLFTLPHQKENNWKNALKTCLWILISILLAYVFIIGILGGHWVASDSRAALNVMEAAFIPGEVIERADYPVLAFWIIGVFALISGYMFYAKEAFLLGTGLRHKKQGKWGLWIVMAGVIVLAYLWSEDMVADYFAKYMLWGDVLISLLIPIVLLMRRGGKGVAKGAKKVALLLLVAGATFLMSGCDNGKFSALTNQQSSIEHRDYVTHIAFGAEGEITFTVADIKKYLSEGTGDFETKEEKLQGDSLAQVMDSYYGEKGRQLDVGHLSGITFYDVEEERLREYLLEMSNMTVLGKSVTVVIEREGVEIQEIPLRQLIKNAYAGENLS